mmetsp:Transcript_18121/g.54572  ORF Transcript_18121/g.54572 Transcript_18121/m.54572 type:complete len:289 (+) Transcript_18121:956-1822(+)
MQAAASRRRQGTTLVVAAAVTAAAAAAAAAAPADGAAAAAAVWRLWAGRGGPPRLRATSQLRPDCAQRRATGSRHCDASDCPWYPLALQREPANAVAAWAAATEWVALAADAAGWGVRAAVQGGNRPRTACGHAQPAATQLPASTPATVDVAVAAAAAATAASRMEARNQVHVIAAIAAVVGAVAKHHAAPTLVGELLCDAETDCAVANFAHLMHLDPSRGPAARPQQSALPRAAAAAHLAAAVAERVRVDLLAESESGAQLCLASWLGAQPLLQAWPGQVAAGCLQS